MIGQKKPLQLVPKRGSVSFFPRFSGTYRAPCKLKNSNRRWSPLTPFKPVSSSRFCQLQRPGASLTETG